MEWQRSQVSDEKQYFSLVYGLECHTVYLLGFPMLDIIAPALPSIILGARSLLGRAQACRWPTALAMATGVFLGFEGQFRINQLSRSTSRGGQTI